MDIEIIDAHTSDGLFLDYEAVKSELGVVLTVLANVITGRTNLSQAREFLELNYHVEAQSLLQ